MNLQNIKRLIKNEKIKDAIIKILEYEQSQLHKSKPWYKETYYNILEELVECENNKDQT